MSTSGVIRSKVTSSISKFKFAGSADYWERRYAKGGDSGAGSYGDVARFKADSLNAFVSEHGVQSVIEFGSGDGNQVGLSSYPKYIGLDVSATAIRRCAELYADDGRKSFLRYDPAAFVNHGALAADLALSLDVILHLVEDEVFDTYMRHLFGASRHYVAVFSPNEERPGTSSHVRYRRFTPWVQQNAPEWRLISHLENPYKAPDSSIADFYFFEHT
jgi:hypothetical protein